MKKLILILSVTILASCNYSKVKKIDEFSIVESVEANYNFKKPYYVITSSYNFVSLTEYRVGDTIILKPTRKKF